MPSSPAAITVHGQQPSRPDATPVLSYRPPPPTRTHHEPPPRSWSTARAQCQHDTGSATSTTISQHNSESATLDPTLRPPVRDPQSAIHESSADVSATQSELISPVTAVRAAHGKIARHLHTAARPPGHEWESTELLIRRLPAHPGPPHPRTQSLNCC
ncbi:unnamed protein product [Pleuronectes platessa]|uniref:Uncharacterized protein n=1 Tax=Pleuronectes platessa TaxID=8262 RepID=A0A9N7TJQ8_PLEPL|nr:unnamed protein product [Pleuronectes platessa]